MKLIEEYRVPFMGLSVAAAVLAIGSLGDSVHATGCRTGVPCTYLQDGNTYEGQCGTSPSDGSCVCTYNGNYQTQAACTS